MSRVDLIVRLAVVAELALIGITWRLWFCATDFPRVPLVPLFLYLPTPVVRMLSVAFIGSLIATVISGWRQNSLSGRWLTAATLLPGCLTVCCNQHCLQPWHWLYLILLVYQLMPARQSLVWMLCRLLPCIYIFAAVSRFGPGIDVGMSRQIMVALRHLSGLRTVATDSQVVTWMCILAATAETVIGVLLLVPRMHRIGMMSAVIMHVILMATLGPVGLRQHAAVVIWNSFLAAWVILLYWRRSDLRHQDRFCAALVSAISFLWPALALFGVTDSWTGWQLYSPRPEVVRIQVHADAVSKLPPCVRPHVKGPDLLEDWCTVRIDRWSLQSAGVPLYPEARFQLAITVAITQGISDDEQVRVRVNSPARPNWWVRTKTDYGGRSEILRATRNFQLNAEASGR